MMKKVSFTLFSVLMLFGTGAAFAEETQESTQNLESTETVVTKETNDNQEKALVDETNKDIVEAVVPDLKEDVAKEKITKLETSIKEVKEKAEKSKEKGLVTLVNEGSLSAYGEGSRFGIIHDTFGVALADDKIEASTHGQEVSYEYVLEKNPDILFVIDRTKAIGGDDSKNNVAENELVKQTNAGKNDKVISLTPDVWYLSGGGIESTELMIEDVLKAFK